MYPQILGIGTANPPIRLTLGTRRERLLRAIPSRRIVEINI